MKRKVWEVGGSHRVCYHGVLYGSLGLETVPRPSGRFAAHPAAALLIGWDERERGLGS